jgi:hypothetical protein
LARVLTSSSVIAPHVVLSLHALLALQAPASAAPASTADQTIVWFRSPDAAAVDGRALLDAVAVYTRDLGLTVRTAAATRPVPADAISAGDAVAALRAQGARLGFWCEMRPGADVAMLTVVAADGHLELHLVERTGAHEAEQYRAIALKLRSVLVGTAAPEPAIVVAPPPAPPAPPAPSAPAPAGPDLSLRARPPAPPPWTHLFMTIGYRLSTPLDSAAARHAMAIDLALALGSTFEVEAGTALSPPLQRTEETTISGGVGVGVDTVSVFDWPIMIGARVVRRGSRITFGGGPFAALHLQWASASGADRMQQSSFAASGGAGAELLARLPLIGRVAGEIRLYGEVPMPTTGYSLRGTGEVLSLGPRAGLALGLSYPAP